MKLGITDERIKKKSNQLYASLYPLMLIITAVTVSLKYLFITQNFSDYILEIIATVISVLYLFIRTLVTQIPLFNPSDECINEIQNRYRMHSFSICIFIYTLGQIILVFIFNKFILASIYTCIWFIPTCIYIIKSTKEGLFILGDKKPPIKGILPFSSSLVIGSLFFGIITEWKSMFSDGSIHLTGLIKIVGTSIAWGILFYIFLKCVNSVSKRYENNQLIESQQESKNDI